MSDAVKQKRKATYEDILRLPENVVGEIIDGELFVSPRPRPEHALAASRLNIKLGSPFGGGGEGPGGWWILSEPEIHLGKKPDNDTFVPDLAGWRKEGMPKLPSEAYFSIVPDWVCEILSPSNARLDRVKKVPKYAEYGTKHLWLINPRDKTLEAFRLENRSWLLMQTFVEADKVKIAPFEAMAFDLGALWE
jgi:Uma2 family endonuclease